MTYAIIEVSGKQLRIETGKFYDVNYIKGEPGDIVNLKRILLINKTGTITLGYPCIPSKYIKAKILKHFKHKKITVFKMKSKKNNKIKRGHRQELTRLLIQEIL